MKKILFVICVSLLLSGCGAGDKIEQGTEDDEKAAAYLKERYHAITDCPKVILDCDMTYLGDDAMCMCLLAQADSLGLIDLVGITITGGNSFVAVGTNAALTQLERIDRADIPVYMGTDMPINGFRDLEAQEKIVGRIDHWGAMYRLDNYIEPEKYHELDKYYDRKWGYSEAQPKEQSSVDFMIEAVKRYPGEVMIISVGAPTNIALACQKDELFAVHAAGIIYAGTILKGKGTYTPYADFNCFYDAQAFDICFESAFPKQTVIPHDVAKDAVLNKAVFDQMNEKPDTLVSRLWLENVYTQYRRSETKKENCLDAIAAVTFLIPSCVRDTRNLYVAVDTDESHAEYGSISTSENPQEGYSQSNITFITALDTEEYWNFATDLLCHVQGSAEKK